ncbi:MAG: hypothetical protein H8F28_20850 [Fibrella sp.]|nr:hypothetical protein [Armatimonadota bacterium]
MTPKQKAILFSATALVSFFAGTLPVCADTVVTFDRETSGSLRPERQRRASEDGGGNDAPQPAPARTDPKQTVTVHLKNALARVEFRPLGAKPETAPSTILLYDGMAQKVYTLDTAAKTYFVQNYKEAVDGEQRPNTNANEGMASRMTFAGSVDVKAARANNAFVSKEILGTQTRQYLISGNVDMKFNTPQGAVPQNSTPRVAGGYPRSNTTVTVLDGGRRNRRSAEPAGPGAGRTFTPPSIAVDGEIWSTDGTVLFTAGRDTPVAAIYRLMLPDNAEPFANTLTKPLITRLKNMKSLPGESTVSFRMNANFRNNGNNTDAPAETPLTTHLTMKEMKTDATLEDALFAIPTDFKEAERPAATLGRPGGGGRGQGGGRRSGGNQGNE